MGLRSSRGCLWQVLGLVIISIGSACVGDWDLVIWVGLLQCRWLQGIIQCHLVGVSWCLYIWLGGSVNYMGD